MGVSSEQLFSAIGMRGIGRALRMGPGPVRGVLLRAMNLGLAHLLREPRQYIVDMTV